MRARIISIKSAPFDLATALAKIIRRSLKGAKIGVSRSSSHRIKSSSFVVGSSIAKMEHKRLWSSTYKRARMIW